MNQLKNIFAAGMEVGSPRPSLNQDWRNVTLYGVGIYLIVLIFRLSLAGKWDHPELWVDGERILATHDAYFWLAKAKGVGVIEGYPLAIASRFIHDLTGISYGLIGFWGPPVISSLVAVVAFLWGWLLGGKQSGISAGLLGGLVPGFFYRSRLGYYDTDIFTLLMPLLVAFFMAVWLRRHIRPFWLPLNERDIHERSFGHTLWLAFVMGMATRFAAWWHFDIANFIVVLFFISAFLLMLLGHKGHKTTAGYELLVFLLAALPGMAGGQIGLWPFDVLVHQMPIVLPYEPVALISIVLSFVLACALYLGRKHEMAWDRNWICFAVLFLFVVLATHLFDKPLTTVFMKLTSYMKPVVETLGTDSPSVQQPIYPSVVQSIIEAKNIPLAAVLERSAYWPVLGWVALASSLIVLVFHPLAALLVPFIALSVLSMWAGVRFTMFGGTALMICLGVCLSIITNKLVTDVKYKRLVGYGVQLAVTLPILAFVYFQYVKLPLTPVVPRAQAEALIELGKRSDKSSFIWTWWDWGYASEYFAGMESVIDGGRHSGRDIFPVALALSSHSPVVSNQVIRLATVVSKDLNTHRIDASLIWKGQSASEAMATVNSLGKQTDIPSTQKQYLVVNWKDLAIAKWITFYGNWDLESGTTREATIGNYNPGELGFNIQQGAVRNRKGGGGLVSDITILDESGAETKEYYMNKLSPRLHPKLRHLVINKVSRQSIIMDRIAYRSMMTRLLIGDPNDPEISKYFKLVVDKLPFSRIYEVVQ